MGKIAVGMSQDMLADIVREYVETLLWSETGDDGEPLDATYEADDIAESAKAEMRADVENFVRGCESERPHIFGGMSAGTIGHNFALTRNGHGAGFWDLGLGDRGDWLTEQCRPYGTQSLYVGDDGKIYAGG